MGYYRCNFYQYHELDYKKKKESNIDIICNGTISKNTLDNELLEDLKGLIRNTDTIKISPNINVYTNEVSASHAVTIGSFNEEEKFYLKTKGLSVEKIEEMLTLTFMMNILSNDFQDKIRMEVQNFE